MKIYQPLWGLYLWPPVCGWSGSVYRMWLRLCCQMFCFLLYSSRGGFEMVFRALSFSSVVLFSKCTVCCSPWEQWLCLQKLVKSRVCFWEFLKFVSAFVMLHCANFAAFIDCSHLCGSIFCLFLQDFCNTLVLLVLFVWILFLFICLLPGFHSYVTAL